MATPPVRPLPFSVETSSILHNDENNEDNSEDDESFTESVDREPTDDTFNHSKHKLKSHDNPVPNLIDQKRQLLEKGLPAQQRDQFLLGEAKEDSDPHVFLFSFFSFSALIFSIGCLAL